MHLGFVQDIVVILGAAIVVVVLLSRFGIPSILGLILTGVLIGPGALGLIGDVHEVELLAEVGVVLLLFGIGLELSLDRLQRLWRAVLLGGTLQVGVTLTIAMLIGRGFGLSWNAAIFLGCLVAVSSTAIVLRGLQSRGEVDAPHGRLSLGILIFQDFCVVPMMLLIPILAGESGGPADTALALGKALGVMAGVVVVASFVAPKILDLVAKARQRDMFVLTVFLICIGTAWVVSLAGVSLALGAFFGGVVVAGSGYRHQAMSEVIPLREVLTSIFFVSVGMLLDPAHIASHFGAVTLLLLAILLGKALLIMILASLIRMPLRVSVMTGAALAQVGEFSFILNRAAAEYTLLPPELTANLNAAATLSMLLTPLGLALGPTLAAGISHLKPLARLMDIPDSPAVAVDSHAYRDHVIIAGYGVSGRELARSLRDAGVKYVIVDLNPLNVQAAADAGEPAYYGDVTSTEVLEHLGAEHARELVMLINDPRAVRRAVVAARPIAPDMHIVVRSTYLADVDPLRKAGADYVIPAELEAAVEVSAYLLGRRNMDADAVNAQRRRIRAEHGCERVGTR